jgi:hypothetical protein
MSNLANSKWKINLISSGDLKLDYTTEPLYELCHLKKEIRIKFTKDQLYKVLKDDNIFSKVFGNVLSDMDIIEGQKLINTVLK